MKIMSSRDFTMATVFVVLFVVSHWVVWEMSQESEAANAIAAEQSQKTGLKFVTYAIPAKITKGYSRAKYAPDRTLVKFRDHDAAVLCYIYKNDQGGTAIPSCIPDPSVYMGDN